MIDRIANRPKPTAMSTRTWVSSDIVTKMPMFSAT